MELSAKTWQIVRPWTYFHKDTLCKQLLRAADSIPENIDEGHERYTFKDHVRFSYYSRGSSYEYETHLRIALNRGLVEESKYSEIKHDAWVLGRLLNGFIRHLGRLKPEHHGSKTTNTQPDRKRSLRPEAVGSRPSDDGPSPWAFCRH